MEKSIFNVQSPGGLNDDGISADAFPPTLQKKICTTTKTYKIYLYSNDSWLKLSLKVLNLTAMLSAFFYA